MRSFTLGIIVFFWAFGALASINDLACDSWSVVTEKYSEELAEDQNAPALEKAHAKVRKFLATAEESINEALENGNGFKAILECSIVEEATDGFTRSCLDDSEVEMISEELKQTCLSMHR